MRPALILADRVGLVGHPQVDAVDRRQRSVEFGSGGGSCPDTDLETFAARARLGDPASQGGRDRLRVAGAGEPAHPDIGAGLDQRGGLLGRHHLVGQASVPDVREIRHRRKAPSLDRAHDGRRSGQAPAVQARRCSLVRCQVPRRCVALILTLATMASPDHDPGPYRGQPNCRGLRADRGQFLNNPTLSPSSRNIRAAPAADLRVSPRCK